MNKTIELKLTIDSFVQNGEHISLYSIADSDGKVRIVGRLSPTESESFVPLNADSLEARAAFQSMNHLFCVAANEAVPNFFKHD